MIKVCLIINQNKFRNTLENIIEQAPNVEIFSSGINYPHIKERFIQDLPNIVIIESDPLDDGIKLVELLRSNYPTIRVIVFVSPDLEENVLALAKIGVKSFLQRTQTSQLLNIIEIITFGGVYFPDNFADIFQRKISGLNASKATEGNLFLSPFDRALIKLICEGLSSTQIGAIMNKSHRTIEDHRDRLYKKFNVSSKEKFIAEAVKKNVV